MKFDLIVFGLTALFAGSIAFAQPAQQQKESAATSKTATDQDEEGEWIQLFNGKDLEGWTPKIRGYELGDNFGETFKVEDGVIKTDYAAYDKFDKRYGHLFYKEPFSNYIIRVEYRVVGDQCPGGEGWALRNSGIMIHGQDPKTMTKDQDFPVSIEVQLLGGNGKDERTNANLCTPGTNVVRDGELRLEHCMSSTSKTYNGDQWVTVEVEVHGGKTIKHILDGEVVMSYEKPQLDPRDANAKELIKGEDLILTGGSISLQSESHPIEFRKVELKKLDAQ